MPRLPSRSGKGLFTRGLRSRVRFAPGLAMQSQLRLAAVLVVSAIAVSGCNDILSDQAAQEGQIGDAIVTTQRCFFGGVSSSPPYTCDPMTEPLVDETIQGMIAYQVPPGVTPPSSLSGVTNATGDVRHSTYSFSQSYTDQLEVTSAALPGMRWRGYISEPELYTAAEHVAQVETISARFGLPRGPDGGPAQGPFKWLTMIGIRIVNADLPAGRPVGGCGSALAGGYVTPGQTSPTTDTWCGNYPLAVPAPSVLQTSDFGIVAPAAQSTQPGQTLDVPFAWEMAGPLAGTFALAARTDLPGAAAAPADAALPPGSDSKGAEVVHLTVPAGAQPGDYRLGLSATLPSGQSRSTVVPVHVDAATAGATPSASGSADRSGPRLTLAGHGRQTLKDALAHGVRLDLGCSEPCRLVASLLLDRSAAKRLHVSARRVQVGSKALSLAQAGRRTVRVRFSKKAAKRLRKVRTVKLAVKVAGADRAGNRSASTRRIRLR